MDATYFENAVRLEQVIEEDGRLVIDGLPFRRGQRVDVTLLPVPPADARRFATAKEWRESGLIGLWKDRTDIEDSTEFVNQIREKLQRPRYLPHDPDGQ